MKKENLEDVSLVLDCSWYWICAGLIVLRIDFCVFVVVLVINDIIGIIFRT